MKNIRSLIFVFLCLIIAQNAICSKSFLKKDTVDTSVNASVSVDTGVDAQAQLEKKKELDAAIAELTTKIKQKVDDEFQTKADNLKEENKLKAKLQVDLDDFDSKQDKEISDLNDSQKAALAQKQEELQKELDTFQKDNLKVLTDKKTNNRDQEKKLVEKHTKEEADFLAQSEDAINKLMSELRQFEGLNAVPEQIQSYRDKINARKTADKATYDAMKAKNKDEEDTLKKLNDADEAATAAEHKKLNKQKEDEVNQRLKDFLQSQKDEMNALLDKQTSERKDFIDNQHIELKNLVDENDSKLKDKVATYNADIKSFIDQHNISENVRLDIYKNYSQQVENAFRTGKVVVSGNKKSEDVNNLNTVNFSNIEEAKADLEAKKSQRVELANQTIAQVNDMKESKKNEISAHISDNIDAEYELIHRKFQEKADLLKANYKAEFELHKAHQKQIQDLIDEQKQQLDELKAQGATQIEIEKKTTEQSQILAQLKLKLKQEEDDLFNQNSAAEQNIDKEIKALNEATISANLQAEDLKRKESEEDIRKFLNDQQALNIRLKNLEDSNPAHLKKDDKDKNADKIFELLGPYIYNSQEEDQEHKVEVEKQDCEKKVKDLQAEVADLKSQLSKVNQPTTATN